MHVSQETHEIPMNDDNRFSVEKCAATDANVHSTHWRRRKNTDDDTKTASLALCLYLSPSHSPFTSFFAAIMFICIFNKMARILYVWSRWKIVSTFTVCTSNITTECLPRVFHFSLWEFRLNCSWTVSCAARAYAIISHRIGLNIALNCVFCMFPLFFLSHISFLFLFSFNFEI